MKKIVLLILASLNPLFAQNSGKISGIVRNAMTQEPLPGVNVVIKGTTLGTATDADTVRYSDQHQQHPDSSE